MKTTRRDSSGGEVIGVTLLALLCSACPDGVGTTDGGGEPPADTLPDVAMDDLADATAEPGDGTADGGRDAEDDLRDAADRMDAPRDDGGVDAVVPGCIPGMSVACACEDGRMGAQVCRADGTFASCRCVTADAATDAPPDVILPPLGPRLITPQSVSRVTSRRPTMRWVLPEGVMRARVELCGDRACARMLQMQEVTGTSWRPAAMLAPGVVFWRVRGLAADGSVAWTSATWEYLVGRRDAPVDTSFGTLKDFNNDGYDDVAIREDYDSFRERYLSIFQGRSERGTSTPTYRIVIPEGYQVEAGDFNGDGIADLAVPVGEHGSFRAPAGTIQVYYGRSGRLSTTPDLEIRIRPTLSSGTLWDFSVAAGDFDGDGFSDIIAMDSGIIQAGREREPYTLRLFRGSAAGLSNTESTSIPTTSGFVFNVTRPDAFLAIGDVDMDGFIDLLTSYASQDSIDLTLRDVGRAWVVQGRPSFPSTVWTAMAPPTRGARFGTKAAAIGDVNGDQIADLAITSRDSVSVYLGTGGAIPTRPVRTLTSPAGSCVSPEEGFGGSLGAAGDFNGDGRADLSIGAPCLPARGVYYGEGMAFIYDGTDGGVATTPRTLLGMFPNSLFGIHLGGFGDFNGDGFDDLSIVETGEVQVGHELRRPPVWVYFGSTLGILPTTPRWDFAPALTNFNSPVARLMRFHGMQRGV